MQAYNIKGKKFGRLTVLSRTAKPKTTSVPGSYWLCECECGTKRVVKGSSLVYGFTNSCGCYKKEVSEAMMTGSAPPQLTDGHINERFAVWAKREEADPKQLREEMTQHLHKTRGRYTPIKIVEVHGRPEFMCIIDGNPKYKTIMHLDDYLHEGSLTYMYF